MTTGPSDRPTTSAEAYELKLEDGVAVIFLEGMVSQREARSVAKELTRYLESAVRRRGQRHVVVAVPPQVRMRVVRGRELKMQATADNRVVFEIQDGGGDGSGAIIIPKRW